jgi:hypothetical protein
MTTCMMRRSFSGLEVNGDEAIRVLSKIKTGTNVLVDIKDMSRRSTKQHAYWFAMAGILHENQELIKDFDTFRKALTARLGFYEIVILPDGAKERVEKSLAFHKMAPDEFGRLVDSTLSFAELMGIDRDGLTAATKDRTR